jgi:hypothetical protein
MLTRVLSTMVVLSLTFPGVIPDANTTVEHLRRKLHLAGSRVRTAEDFIRYCATEPSLSGEAVRDPLCRRPRLALGRIR